ncbi:hypothetical protein CERZMDRAFT_102066 [Cercospora zeae-maydis SCOH1-5]|uniref:Apple domain-containing protein n=1 Tax=Cercospora zeae-maydis SCOH1-5 TaxID=717836 RepID=A0A6A6F3J7_9PEZI|nr:hypothetical protein CERZMDRAFT_102066 [Cercospora zeae-maydis SCOH1-5]
MAILRVFALAASLMGLAVAQNEPGSAEGLTCPESNNREYIAPSGARFLVECYIDHLGGDLLMQSVTTFQQCVDACDRTSGCVDVSFQGAACYMKASVGRAVRSDTVYGARLISPPTIAPAFPLCPASNGTNYTTAGNKTFRVECGIDYVDLTSQYLDVVNLGRDGESGERWLQQCIEECGKAPNCVDISLSGSACYLKDTLEGTTVSYNDDVFGARLINPTPPLVPRPTSSASWPSTSATSVAPPAPPSPTATPIQCGGLNPANGTLYFDTTSGINKTFIIECGVDYATERDELLSATDLLGGSGELWLTECISLCARTARCVDISLSGRACYLKSNVAGREIVRQSETFGGARLLSPLPGSESVGNTTTVSPPYPTPVPANATSVVVPANGTSAAVTLTSPEASATGSSVEIITVTPLPATATSVATTTTTSRAGVSTSSLLTSTRVSSAPPSATSAAAVCRIDTTPQCPACNRKFMKFEDLEDPDTSYNFRIQCGVEYLNGAMEGGGLGYRGTTGFRACSEDCAYTPGCFAVAYFPQTGLCSFSSTIDAGARANSSVWAAYSMDY